MYAFNTHIYMQTHKQREGVDVHYVCIHSTSIQIYVTVYMSLSHHQF